MRKNRLIVALFALSVLYLLFLLVSFGSETRVTRAAGVKSDAIVVLTGGIGRVEEGLRLLRMGASDVLILSGVNRDADTDSIFLNSVSAAERSRIVLEKNSRSTYENAVEVRRLMDEQGYRSIILVTSGYHMKRAAYIFRRIMTVDVRIVEHSISTPNFDEQRWWGGTSLTILLAEFMKYYWHVIEFTIGGRGT